LSRALRENPSLDLAATNGQTIPRRDRAFIEGLIKSGMQEELREKVIISMPSKIKARLKELAREDGRSLGTYIVRSLIMSTEWMDAISSDQKSQLYALWVDDNTRPAMLVREAVAMLLDFAHKNPGRLGMMREVKQIKFAREMSLTMRNLWATTDTFKNAKEAYKGRKNKQALIKLSEVQARYQAKQDKQKNKGRTK
jgi:hypothetical protein